jgi:dihydrodipicolinate synthase/N-acetylneuraminate lyase
LTLINNQNFEKMKKLLSVLIIAGMATLVACGPSAEEIAKKEKAKQDSIALVQKEQATQDSIAAAQKAAEEAIAAAQKAKEDSIAAVAAKKGGKKKK